MILHNVAKIVLEKLMIQKSYVLQNFCIISFSEIFVHYVLLAAFSSINVESSFTNAGLMYSILKTLYWVLDFWL